MNLLTEVQSWWPSVPHWSGQQRGGHASSPTRRIALWDGNGQKETWTKGINYHLLEVEVHTGIQFWWRFVQISPLSQTKIIVCLVSLNKVKRRLWEGGKEGGSLWHQVTACGASCRQRSILQLYNQGRRSRSVGTVGMAVTEPPWACLMVWFFSFKITAAWRGQNQTAVPPWR